MKISYEQFVQNLRRYYEADEMPDGEIRRLYEAWRKYSSDSRLLLGAESSFELKNSPARGLAWWEDRWAKQADYWAHRPIEPLDQVNMFLSSSYAAHPNPKPRQYRPEWLFGRWRCLGWAEDGEHFVAPVPAQYLVLRRDGLVEAEGSDPYQAAGSTFCVQQEYPSPEMLLTPPDTTLSNMWRIVEHAGDEMLLSPPGTIGVRGRFTKVA